MAGRSEGTGSSHCSIQEARGRAGLLGQIEMDEDFPDPVSDKMFPSLDRSTESRELNFVFADMSCHLILVFLDF